jgi:[FeFe] hydrogenase H-cluster maturation GTPase HydF
VKKTPSNLRLHIGLLGRRNTGKSSLLNAVAGQSVSIVSEHAGTTADPVKKPMELRPLGPVMFVDTAGLDDEGDLGGLRVGRTLRVLNRLDMAVLVSDGAGFGTFEETLLETLAERHIPAVVALNKADVSPPAESLLRRLAKRGIPAVPVSARTGIGLFALEQAIIDTAPSDIHSSTPIISDLVGRGETAVLVIPIDKEAPKGRIITPQVQALRELLDSESYSVVVQAHQLGKALSRLRRPPGLVVTDSQAFEAVARITPRSIPLTSFSILFSRFKGDLKEQVRGVETAFQLTESDRILVAEACSHHPIQEDIGHFKIPRWLRARTGKNLVFEHVRGREFPEDLADFKLVIHCGACMWSRREMQHRIRRCQQAGVPITNYGIVIAAALGILTRALAPFPELKQMESAVLSDQTDFALH